MTYLATEMLLYLLSAAIIGLALGWMIWGLGQRRRLNVLRGDLMAVIEQEKEAHHQTRLSLDDAQANSKKALETAEADASRSIAELKESLEAERVVAKETQTELERVHAGIDATIEAGRASVQATIDQALETANAEKAAASQAMAKEAQSRAQIEELRLLIGAEKLAAESARSELEETRSSMQAELAAERTAHEQAKIALNDIRSTLARTLGAGAFDLAGDGRDDQTGASPAGAGFGQAEGSDRGNGLDGSSRMAGTASAFSMVTDMSAAGDALNNPDLDEADIEDQEGLRMDLSSTIEAEDVSVDPEEVSDQSEDDKVDADDTASTLTGGGLFRPMPAEPLERKRPAMLLDQRPEDGDDLLAIDGISPEIERRLHDCGCYRYGQLAGLTSEDIAWLAEETGLSSFQIAADRWVEQAKALRFEKGTEDDHMHVRHTDRQNAAS